MVKPGDIIIASRGTIGSCGIVSENYGETTINPCVILMRPMGIKSNFFIHLLNMPMIQTELKKIGSGAVQPMISQGNLKKFMLIVPPDELQDGFISFVEQNPINTGDEKKGFIETWKDLFSGKNYKDNCLIDYLANSNKVRIYSGEEDYISTFNNCVYDLRERFTFIKTEDLKRGQVQDITQIYSIILGDKANHGFKGIEFDAIDENGNEVVIDSYHSDGNGNTANTANWMIEYQDHIDIIDYKLKNINDSDYDKQLLGYKNYIEKLSNKKVNIYLYSLFDSVYREIK